jgi:heat shock protein HtpX
LSESTNENQRRVRMYVVGFALLLVVILTLAWGVLLAAFGAPWIVAVVPALPMAAGAAVLARDRADAMALRRIGAMPADAGAHARYHNLVEGLCFAAGLPKPSLYVLEDPALNACSVGRDPKHASIVVTTGLLENLSRIELEGVLAHELSHIKSHDIAVSTLAVPLALVAPGLAARAIGAHREALADVTGVSLTRYPPGLISALERLRDDGASLRSTHRAVAHLWIEAPAAIASHPPLEERIQALREL